MASTTVELKKIGELPAITNRGRFELSAKRSAMDQLMPALQKFIKDESVPTTNRLFCRYTDVTIGGMTVEVGFVTDGPFDGGQGQIAGGRIDAGTYASLIHTGHFDELGRVHSAVESWIGEIGRVAKGVHYEFFLNDPFENPDPNEWETEVWWLLTD